MNSRVALIAGVVVALGLGGCSGAGAAAPRSTGTAGAAVPRSSAELHNLLLTTKTAPPGMRVSSGGAVDDRHDYDSVASHRTHPGCGDLKSVFFVFGGTLAQPVGTAPAS